MAPTFTMSLPERTAEDPMHCLQEHAPPREDSQIKCAHARMHRHISHTHMHMHTHTYTYMQYIHSHMHTHSHNHIIPTHNTCVHIHTTLKHTRTYNTETHMHIHTNSDTHTYVNT